MRKKIFKYSQNTVLFFLTIILLFCVYIIIRDCSIPLVKITPTLDKYLARIFINPHSDRTAYNIAISYFAAYIFYIVQIYIPFVINNKHGIRLLNNDITNNINDIKLLILLISELTYPHENYLCIKKVPKSFYIIEEYKEQIFKITFLETYHKLKTRILQRNQQILSHFAISYLDLHIVELLSTLPINELLIIADNIYVQKLDHTKTKITKDFSLKQANYIISQLEKRYHFHFENYYLSDNINHDTTYETLNLHMCHYSDNELERKVKTI